MSGSEMKLKEKNDENLKNSITEKIFEIMTKNNLILNQHNKINFNNLVTFNGISYQCITEL